MSEPQTSESVSTKLERIAEQAKRAPTMAFRSLAHHIDIDWLHEAYKRTRKDGATGVDGRSGAEYAANLTENLQRLLDRAKSGTYVAPPVKRVHIPKGSGGETRPLGIPTFEDKVLQRAVAMLLGAIYEQDFYNGSYGFRPGRSAHQALDDLWKHAMKSNGGWVLEVDVRKFFDNVDHGHLREILRRRIVDGVLTRLIGKWLNAGVLEDGAITRPEAGTPQGGVISPMLANIFLHAVLDEWFERDVRPRLAGQARLVRYADDAVMLFADEKDARRVMEVLPKRLEKYGLTLHPEKTRLVEFRRSDGPSDGPGPKGPGSFDFLGFTHFWSRSRSGGWVVKRKTAKDRFQRALGRIKQWCKDNRHRSVQTQRNAICRKLTGHFNYFGIIGNVEALGRFRYEVCRIWHKWLSRRSQRGSLTWQRFNGILRRWTLPVPRVVARLANP